MSGEVSKKLTVVCLTRMELRFFQRSVGPCALPRWLNQRGSHTRVLAMAEQCSCSSKALPCFLSPTIPSKVSRLRLGRRLGRDTDQEQPTQTDKTDQTKRENNERPHVSVIPV